MLSATFLITDLKKNNGDNDYYWCVAPRTLEPVIKIPMWRRRISGDIFQTIEKLSTHSRNLLPIGRTINSEEAMPGVNNTILLLG
jgi:hypothetical protein